MARPKEPVLLKYLLKNLKQGVFPSKDELDEIQRELGTECLGRINLELIEIINDGVKPQQRASNEPTRANTEPVIEMVNVETQQPQQQPKPKKPLASTKTALTPADTKRVRVIGNGG